MSGTISFVATLITGLICILLGIQNMRGDISSLHSYHRHRVSEEDKLPFGRIVGAGTIIVGASVIVMGAFLLVSELTENSIFATIGTVAMTVGLLIGVILSFYGMKKYNNGIF